MEGVGYCRVGDTAEGGFRKGDGEGREGMRVGVWLIALWRRKAREMWVLKKNLCFGGGWRAWPFILFFQKERRKKREREAVCETKLVSLYGLV